MNLVLRFALVVAATVVGAWAMFSRTDPLAAAPAGAISASAPDAPTPGATAKSDATSTPGATPKRLATVERLRERSLARWDLLHQQKWIDAYEMLTSEQRRAVPLGKYLSMTQHHTYDNPAIERVLRVDATDGYLVARAVWTPTHPELAKVKLEPGQSLTSEISMVESWRWEGDDWFYVQAQRADEFQREHPDIELEPK
jgi:hypothetical protein